MPFFSDNSSSNTPSSNSTAVRFTKKPRLAFNGGHPEKPPSDTQNPNGLIHPITSNPSPSYHSTISGALHQLPDPSHHEKPSFGPSKRERKRLQRETRDEFIEEDGIRVRKRTDLVQSVNKTSIIESNEIPMNLRYFFQLRIRTKASDANTERPVNSKCEENIIFLSTALMVKQLEMNVPLRIMNSKDENQAISCPVPGLGFKYHLIRLIGLIKLTESQNILNCIESIKSQYQNHHNLSNEDSRYFQDILNNDILELGYFPNGEIKGYNKTFLRTSSVESILSKEEDPIIKLNYGLIKNILTKIYIQLHPLETNLCQKSWEINHFAHKTVQKQNNGNRKLKYGGLATTIKIGQIEQLISNFPNIIQDHADSLPSMIIQISGPKSIVRFPQLHLDVELNVGKILVVPLGNLLHHLINDDNEETNVTKEKRIIMICYTHKSIEEEYEKSKNKQAEQGEK